ncbi:hypothetical protein SeMB42_g03178 [Synchytrium endobioticum]|uniref:Uncharacterized protein n=1 Tax=Synchytrium endobioticum TaxID=286115 RepID=A0A507DAJ8_9FUNG|nr:hypothetical protein SeLEV6574_g04115 [Synchytrium endobioticum]TPX47838.1 hypothetical protein SeMB42_g03178 [Synchytrium endobioticum]
MSASMFAGVSSSSDAAGVTGQHGRQQHRSTSAGTGLEEGVDVTFHGLVETTVDALLIFEACRTGHLKRVTRRLRHRERANVQSGCVFVYDETESGVKRWTDGIAWSPSRILGNFLIYRQLVHKANVSKTAKKEAPQEETLLLSHGKPSYEVLENGLFKKTISVTANGHHQHLVSYFTKSDVLLKRLAQPSAVPVLAELPIGDDLLFHQRFRKGPVSIPPFMLEMASDMRKVANITHLFDEALGITVFEEFERQDDDDDDGDNEGSGTWKASEEGKRDSYENSNTSSPSSSTQSQSSSHRKPVMEAHSASSMSPAGFIPGRCRTSSVPLDRQQLNTPDFGRKRGLAGLGISFMHTEFNDTDPARSYFQQQQQQSAHYPVAPLSPYATHYSAFYYPSVPPPPPGPPTPPLYPLSGVSAPLGYTDPYYTYYPPSFTLKRPISASSSTSSPMRYPPPEYSKPTNASQDNSNNRTNDAYNPRPHMDTGMIIGQDQVDAATLLKFQAHAQSASAPQTPSGNDERVHEQNDGNADVVRIKNDVEEDCDFEKELTQKPKKPRRFPPMHVDGAYSKVQLQELEEADSLHKNHYMLQPLRSKHIKRQAEAAIELIETAQGFNKLVNRFCDTLNGDDPMNDDLDLEDDLTMEGYESLQQTRVMVQELLGIESEYVRVLTNIRSRLVRVLDQKNQVATELGLKKRRRSMFPMYTTPSVAPIFRPVVDPKGITTRRELQQHLHQLQIEKLQLERMQWIQHRQVYRR